LKNKCPKKTKISSCPIIPQDQPAVALHNMYEPLNYVKKNSHSVIELQLRQDLRQEANAKSAANAVGHSTAKNIYKIYLIAKRLAKKDKMTRRQHQSESTTAKRQLVWRPKQSSLSRLNVSLSKDSDWETHTVRVTSSPATVKSSFIRNSARSSKKYAVPCSANVPLKVP